MVSLIQVLGQLTKPLELSWSQQLVGHVKAVPKAPPVFSLELGCPRFRLACLLCFCFLVVFGCYLDVLFFCYSSCFYWFGCSLLDVVRLCFVWATLSTYCLLLSVPFSFEQCKGLWLDGRIVVQQFVQYHGVLYGFDLKFVVRYCMMQLSVPSGYIWLHPDMYFGYVF